MGKKKWVSMNEIHSVQYRGGTWGNKRAILADSLRSTKAPSGSIWTKVHGAKPHSGSTENKVHDACGCQACQGEGFSGWSKTCAARSETDKREACACLQQSKEGLDSVDACGCRPCRGEGWSSTRGK